MIFAFLAGRSMMILPTRGVRELLLQMHVRTLMSSSSMIGKFLLLAYRWKRNFYGQPTKPDG